MVRLRENLGVHINPFRQLARNESGNTAMIFGLLLVPILGFIGLAVDSSRAYNVKMQLQSSLDSAALAGGRFYGFSDRDTKIQNYFDANWHGSVYGAEVSPLDISDTVDTEELKISATATLHPIFVNFLGINNITVGASSTVVDSNTTLEVALVIDTTGSMNSNVNGVQKMASARDAATELLDILFAGKTTDDRLFLSVVPFVQNVNVGNNYSGWLASGSEAAVPWNSGPYPTASGWRGCMFERLNGSGQVIYDTTEESPVVQRFMPFADSYIAPTCTNWSAGMTVAVDQCVYNTANKRFYEAQSAGTTGTTAPTGTTVNGTPFNAGGISWVAWYQGWRSGENFTNTGNYRANPNTFFWYDNRTTGTTTGTNPPSHVNGTSASGGLNWRTSNSHTTMNRITNQDPSFNTQYGYGYNSGCGSALVPMTNVRATAQATIDALQPSTAYGGTMTNVGLIWGWRTISPDWRGLWSGVAADRPFDYGETDNFKALIILTDGENVFQSCSGAFCKGSATPFGYLPDKRLGTAVSSNAVIALNSKVTEVCNNMRAKNIMLYTVMFDLPAGASGTRTLFQGCAGDSSRFFDVSNGDELEDAFKAIAVDLAKLRIAK